MREEAKRIAKKVKAPAQVNRPSLLDIAESEMAKLVWIPINEDLSPSKLAFATKSVSNCYKVFVNNKIPERYHDTFKLHEYGHILFGHLKNDDLRTKQLTRKVLQFWPSIEPHIELDDEDKNKSKIDLVEKYIIPLQGVLQNYAMDMEVNSKLFPTEEERKEMREILSVASMMAQLNDDYVLDIQLEAIEKYLDEEPDEPFAKPIFPEDYDFPDKASYQEYLDYMFLNIDKFMNFLKKDMDMQGQNMPGAGGNSSGSSGSSSKSNSKGKSKKSESDSEEGDESGLSDEDKERLKKQLQRDINGNRKRLTLDDIERLRKAANKSDTDDKSNEKAASEKGHGKNVDELSSGDGADGDADWTGEDGLGFGHKKVERPDVMPLGDGKQLARFLEKEAFSKKIENTRVDVMRLYNRRKYGEKDIISTYRTENLYRPGNLIIVVDCSGSIDRIAIQKMLSVIKQLSKKCGPRSRVIWWDTELCGDTPLRAKQKPTCGGGTDIAEGIKYAREKYLKSSNDKLIIISDYCDSLGKWLKYAKNIKNDITGIAWVNGKYNGSIDTFLEQSCWGGSFSVKEFKNKIHTKIVEV